MEKLEWCDWCGYSMVKKSEDVFSHFDIIPASDGQTVCAMHSITQ